MTKQTSRVAEALIETADDLRRLGIIDAESHEKITTRHLGEQALIAAKPVTGEEIR